MTSIDEQCAAAETKIWAHRSENDIFSHFWRTDRYEEVSDQRSALMSKIEKELEEALQQLKERRIIALKIKGIMDGTYDPFDPYCKIFQA